MPVVLELDLTTGIGEDVPVDPLERLAARRRPPLPDLVARLEEAANDAGVAGLVAKLGHGGLSLAHAEELRAAVARFRSTGRPALAWAESFGELGQGTVAYLLATGFSEIWLQPTGSLGLIGTAASGLFVRRALDRAAVEPLFGQRWEYKNAADTFLRDEFSGPHREATERLAASAFEYVVATVAEARHLSEDRVAALVDAAPLTAGQALEAGLVDRLGYRDAVRAELDRLGHEAARSPEPLVTRTWRRAKAVARRAEPDGDPDRPSLLYLSRYRGKNAALRQLGAAKRPGVGVIHISGPIRQGRSGRGPNGRGAGADSITGAIRSAVADPKTRALVLRVNSPGGSYVASDLIWREVGQARAGGMPVVVSMGEVAGSGGYYVAMGADVIVACATTLTGSIGVLAGKFRANGLLERAGVHVEGVHVGRHARMFSPLTGFEEAEWDKLNEWLDDVYADFVTKAAEGRRMERDALEQVARGRIWTGADAVGRGLVDQLGDLHTAIGIARRRAGLPADAPVRPFPSQSPTQWLQRPRNSDHAALGAHGALATPLATRLAAWPAGALGALLGAEGAGSGELAQLGADLGLLPAGPLLMPGVRLFA